MKYITQDWTSTKDGYLFFVQRLQEMLFHYSDKMCEDLSYDRTAK